MIKTKNAIDHMRHVGQLTAKVLEAVKPMIQPGISTLDIDTFCHDYIVQQLQATPGSLGQYDYPYTVNTSVNDVVCHGWPSHQRLKSGDIVNVDVTVKKHGYYGDSSQTFLVGEVSQAAQHLVHITQACLYQAIAIVRPGITLGDLGHAIQSYAEAHQYSVVREYCGHGIGQAMHEEPQVLHYGKPATGLTLQENMTFTIEPMINAGAAAVKLHNDGWTVTTRDNKLSAQFEHTILVTKKGYEILTLRQSETRTSLYRDLIHQPTAPLRINRAKE